MILRAIRTASFAVVVMLASTSSLQACPSCREAAEAQATAESSSVSQGYSASILLMLGMPMAMLGTGAFFIARAARRGLIPEL